MFIPLIFKELKYQFKSVILYLFLGILLLFYFSQFAPPSANAPLEPLDEMHFLYWKMVGDYSEGKTTSIYLLEQENTAVRVPLSSQQKQHLKDVITKMNPVGLKKQVNWAKLRFQLDYPALQKALDALNAQLGGSTYYGSPYRNSVLLRENRYGQAFVSDPDEKMQILYNMMQRDLEIGQVMRYRLGFGKSIKLTSAQRESIQKAMSEMLLSGKGTGASTRFAVSFDRCLSLAREIDRKLGGGTYYGDGNREQILKREQTYEEAKNDFEQRIRKESIANSYGRLFADYSGITAGFFPVFLTAFILTRDRRTGMHELIYSRPVSSLTYVLSKYAAVILAMLVCYLITATHATLVFSQIARINGYGVDYLAFYKYTFLWILPTLLFSSALGMLLSVLSGNGILAIPVQLVLWFSSLMPLSGNYSLWKPILRFNLLGSYEKYQQWYSSICFNRIFYVALSVVLIVLTSMGLSWRRVSGYGRFTGRTHTGKV